MAAPKLRSARLVSRSVFDVAGRRLGIGGFDRPLLDDECRRLRRAWERSAPPGLEDFEVTPRQVSFLAGPAGVEAAWSSIDRLLSNSSRETASRPVARRGGGRP